MRGTSLIAGAVGWLLFAAAPSAAANLELPPGPNRALVYGQCRTCHDLQYLKESAGIPRAAWSDMLDSMKQYGLRIPPDQRAKILDYLATYLGPNPPPATKASAPAAAKPVDGAALYTEQCSGCHQPQGQGVKDQFPPLAGNHDLYLAADFPVKVVLFGLKGKITVAGANYDNEMPAFGHLSDAEVAAVINYVRGAWGNDKLNAKKLPSVEAAQIATARKPEMTAQAVLGYRRKLQ
jgi:mono/diheme cytochrome c family protein